ncbi:hypothetical protein [Brevibacterium sp. XM4083]|uniref:hypothetical protein n=1 Tax=Brevibacterium sp. XM4083 TaxID=2583238 RepID=UPI0011284C7B|nr:hypothetical protein [Brevibacterium sp. XM4083]MCM1012347.1 hypothetical protein [Brevibacterium sp. XM4083]
MTWHFEATIADDIHRVGDDTGETRWGVVAGEQTRKPGTADPSATDPADDAGVLETAEVILPTGEARLLLVPVLPGGLVIDVVRAFHGLTEGEAHTLLRGMFAELAEVDAATERLSLACFGLDAAGRPRVIPGMRRALETPVRRAVGELLYHALHGVPWTDSLLPVGVALESCSADVQALVTDLLDESSPAAGASLPAVIAEVTPRLSRLGTPAVLPLVPASRDLDPALALTARLRVTTSPAVEDRDLPDSVGAEGAGSGSSRRGLSTVAALRSSGRSRFGRRGEATPDRGDAPVVRRRPGDRGTGDRGTGDRRSGSRGTGRARERATASAVARLCAVVTSPWAKRAALGAAMVVVLLGGLLMVRAWSTGDEASPSPVAADDGAAESADTDAGGLSDTAVAERLGELCAERARVLEAGDEEGLAGLTVPGSTAAAADELIDLAAYSGGTYTITVTDVAVESQSPAEIVVTATMTTTAESGGDQEAFDAKDVVVTLGRHAGQWLIAEVAEA